MCRSLARTKRNAALETCYENADSKRGTCTDYPSTIKRSRESIYFRIGSKFPFHAADFRMRCNRRKDASVKLLVKF